MTKILLVEDDKNLREIYGVRLLAEGYDIVSAGDGEAALAMAIKERPTLIISDVMMPKISGFDMLDILRSTSETKNIKVIMMTALSSEDQRARGEALGADRYLVKSQVGIEDVVRVVHDVLGDLPGVGTSPVPVSAPAQVQPTLPPSQQPINQPASQPASTTTESAPTAPTVTPQPEYQPYRSPVSVPVPPRTPAPTFVSASPLPPVQPVGSYVAPQPPVPIAPTVPAPAATPVQPQPQPTPVPTPLVATPQPSALPQPTAPFSTPRPQNLGDRVIQPLEDFEHQPSGPDLNKLISQELTAPTPPPVVAPTPSTEPAFPVTPPPIPPSNADRPTPQP